MCVCVCVCVLIKTEPCSVLQASSEYVILQAEDSHVSLDCGRRKQSLQTFVDLINLDMEREQKSLDGIQKLVEVYRDKPTFADAETRDEVNQRHANVCGFCCRHIIMYKFLLCTL